MSERQALALRLVVFLLILSLSVVLLGLAGCKKEQPAGGATAGAARGGEQDAAPAAAGRAAGGRRGGTGMRGGAAARGGMAGRGGGAMAGGRGGRRGGVEESPAPAEAGAQGRGPAARGGRAGAAPAGAKVAAGVEATKPGAGPVLTAAQVPVSTKGATTGIPEVDKMTKIRDFAAVFGATTLIKAQDQNGTELEWVGVTPDSGKEKGRQVVMPLSMLMQAEYPELLEGYFPIYVQAGRPLAKIVSKATVTAPRRPKKDLQAIRQEEGDKRRATAAAEQAVAAEAEAAAGASGSRGMRGGGMRGGGMRGGGMRGGGMRGGRGRRGGL